MSVRKVGRCRITVDEREFVWWFDDNVGSLRIASDDKKFVVAYRCCHAIDASPLLRISGIEFPGIGREEKRPVYIVPPLFELAYSLKSTARRVIQWSLQEDHQLIRTEAPLMFRF